METLPSGLAQELSDLARHPADTAGALMDPRVGAFAGDTTVRTVLSRLRRMKRRVYDVFVVDAEGRVTGIVPLQDLALAATDQSVGALARPAVPKVPATAGREEIVEAMAGGSTPTLAVVDFEDRLLGVLSHTALVAAAENEASADIQTMVGASKEERALSPALFAVRKRLPWLQINLATAFLAASVVGLFEETIEQVTALAILLPVVAGQSGNSGAQALAVTMRGLFLREIRVRNWPRVVLKELAVGALNGLAVALVCAAGVYVWSRSPGLSLVIGVAMVLAMIVAGIAGAAIPTILSAVGQDPAQSSSIILTTVTDVAGFFTFLGLARLFASML
jgi:magnesium transporter